MTTTHYHYKPLLPNEIRLLHLSKAKHGETCFRLSHEILDETLEYEAVSYTWGSSIRENIIQHADTGGQAFITANCERVLRSLHSTGNDRIWIDGLCINQDDIVERSQQVRLMGEIFRTAKRTIAYIGEHDDHSRAVMAWASTPIERWPEVLEHEVSPQEHEHASALLKRPIFRRTWVIQEALLSKNLVIRIGPDELDFDMLSTWDFRLASGRGFPHHKRGVITLKTEFSRGGNMSDYSNWARNILKPRTRRLTQKRVLWRMPASALDLITATNLLNPGYLFDVLCATAQYECADPRDKVFALVSLFEKGLPEALQPDYSRSVEELYATVSRFLLSYGVARVLSAAMCDETGRMPSWAVDWRRKLHRDAFGRHDGVFAASSSAGFSSFRETNIRILNNRAIKVRGLRLTQVSTCPRSEPKLAGHEDGANTRDLNVAELLQERLSLSGARPPDQYLHFVSSDGIISLVPKETRQGDWICILLGFTVPFVLRSCPAEEWQLVGECYVQDYMQGEAVQSFEELHVHDPEPVCPLEDFTLV